MIINFITQRTLPQQVNTNQAYCPKYSSLPSYKNSQYPNLAPLAQDTVSFGSAQMIVKPRIYTTKADSDSLDIGTLGYALIKQYILDNPRLNRIARVYYSVLQTIASAEDSIFKVSDNIEHLVKSPESMIKKIIRSGSLKVPDTIRATAFCKNPYDFDNLLKLLSEMEQSGYVVDKVPVKVADLMKRGYIPFDEERMIMNYLKNPKDKDVKSAVKQFFVDNDYDIKEVRTLLDELKALGREPDKDEFLEAFSKLEKMVPDIDIRLQPSKVTSEQIKKLPEIFRYRISKPQSSGYEDIQIRFIRDYIKESDKESQIPHELIILFGENYYNAKTRESTYVYSHLRRFKDLTVKRYLDNGKYDFLTQKFKSTVEAIENLFRREVSKKEFANAKNIDYANDKATEKIIFTDADKEALDTYYKILYKEIAKPYDFAIKRTSKSRRTSLRTSLNKDRASIKEIYDGLKETIEKYNSGEAYHLTDPKPEKVKSQPKSKKKTNIQKSED